MNKLLFVFPFLFMLCLSSFDLEAQNIEATAPNIESMPEYIVIRARDADAFSRMSINIQIKKKSRYRNNLLEFEDWLMNVDGIRASSDLMNVMFEIGYDYVNAFTSNNNSSEGTSNKVSYNMVFKKSEN